MYSPGNGPKLAAAANALGIAGASDDAKATALRQQVSSFGNLQMNEWLEDFTNKVLVSQVFKHMKFSDHFSKAYLKEGISVAAAKEISTSKLLTHHTFDQDKRYPDAQERAKNLNHIIRTVFREYITNTVPWAQSRAAFATETAFGDWMKLQVELLSESFQIRIFNYFDGMITSGVVNTFYAGASMTNWDDRMVYINGLAKNMKLPSAKYTLGYANPTDVANADLVRVQTMTRDRLYLMATTDVVNAIEGEVSTVKFHNAYFDITKYKGTLLSNTLSNDEVILIADNSVQAHFRVNEVASQSWAANMTTEYFLHYWLVAGLVPWAIGIKIKFEDDPSLPLSEEPSGESV